MSYCAYTDVQSDFKNIQFTDTSLVTSSAVTQFIVEASALIDSYVGSRYVTPITGAMSLSLMSLFCRTLVSDRVRGIMANKQQVATDANQQVKSDGFATKDVMKALNDLKDGVSTLSDGVLLNQNASFYSNNNQNGVNARFNKNRKQW